MRRALLLGASVLVVLGAIPVHPASADVAGARASQVAEADWLFIRGDHGTSYLAWAERGLGSTSEAPGPTASVLLAKGRCDVIRRPHFTLITCAGRGIWKEIPFQRFDVDPLLETASVSVRARGFRNEVEWTGRGNVPPPSGGAQFGPGYLDAGAGMGRAARATARIFGDRVRGRGSFFSFAGLGQGAGMFADVFGVFDELDPGPDGTFTFTRHFRMAT